jgi:hypothetical protein
VKIGKSVTETFEIMKIAFGEEAMCRTQTYELWKRFKEGRTSVDDIFTPSVCIHGLYMDGFTREKYDWILNS